jgi:hypothetical protein
VLIVWWREAVLYMYGICSGLGSSIGMKANNKSGKAAHITALSNFENCLA